MDTTTETTTNTRVEMLHALRTFVCQRPGLEPRNYHDAASYRAEYRGILRDRDDALALWRYVAQVASSLTADQLLDAARGGRLTWNAARGEWDYCTGQYFAVEYRAAVCRLLSSALWAYWRDCDGEHANPRRTAAIALPMRIARRWFR
jgi:hypothetical protein